MRSKMICLLGLLLAGVFASGCTSSAWRTRSITNSSGLAGKTTIVVPVKGAAIALQDSTVWTGLLGDELFNKPKRKTLVTTMADRSSEFSSEVVLAEECVDILKRASWSSGTNVTLFNGLEIMRGSGPEFEEKTRVFKATYVGDRSACNDAYIQWLMGGPVRTFSTTVVGSKQFVILEVTIVNSCLKNKSLVLASAMRLMDPDSGKPLASGFAEDKFTVHPIKSAADVDAFAQDYRKCARKVAEKLLKQLKLIS